MMRSLKPMVCFWAAFIFLGVTSGPVLAENDLKIAFVDFEKVFNTYKKTMEENKELQRNKEAKEASAQVLIDEINKLKAEAEILSDEAKNKAERTIRDKLRELKDYTDDSKRDLVRRRNEVFKKITDEIRVIIAAKGAQDGLSLVLDDKALFYKASVLDLTDDIIDVLNDDDKRQAVLASSSSDGTGAQGQGS